MSIKGKILSTISIFALAIVLTFVGVWALTDLDFTVGGNITYTAPVPESHLIFEIVDEDNKTALVKPNDENPPTGYLEIPSKALIDGIEYNVAVIEDYAFESCEEITDISIPASITSIGLYPFSSSNLDTINVDPRNPVYNSQNNCNAIIETDTLLLGCKNTIIPNNVKIIEEDAFFGCTGLTSITIPNGVEIIGACAFEGCRSLTSITIPDSVIEIGLGAFYEDAGLTSVSIGNSVEIIGVEAFWDCKGLTSITIPESVKSIDVDAFFCCTGLESVTIGSGVTSIGSQAFYGCTSLKKVEVKATKVPTGGENMFHNCPLTTGILVPSASVSAYKAKTHWKNYSSKIVGTTF